MNFLEGSFYMGVKDGKDGVIIEDVTTTSYCDNKTVNDALTEYRAGVILGSVIKECEQETFLTKDEYDLY